MQVLVYALRFQGTATVGGVDGNVLRTFSRATGGSQASRLALDASGGTWEAGVAADVWQESELTFTGSATFQLVSELTCGTGVTEMHLRAAGSGYCNSEMEDGRTYGAAVTWVEAGDGQFAGASGLITSNFIVTGSGQVTEFYVGVLHLR